MNTYWNNEESHLCVLMMTLLLKRTESDTGQLILKCFADIIVLIN